MALFPPGQSGNPNGRPKKGQTMTEILSQTLEAQEHEGKTGKEALALKLYALALEGDVGALKYIFERLDGKPLQAIQLPESRPIVLPPELMALRE